MLLALFSPRKCVQNKNVLKNNNDMASNYVAEK